MAKRVEKFEVRNRWTGKVQFTAEIVCGATLRPRLKLGLAIKWAYESGADLSRADLSGADLSDADLRGADLSGADLRGADLSDADLSDADLSRADLRGADLSDADLSGADLRYADLSRADLRRADLSRADLRGADLSGADLSRADLRGADLSGADLSDADLRGADLRRADLRRADLSRADLRYADLSRAPVIPNIHQAVYAAASQPDALDMGDWHRCETTHCRAGWVTTLAGEEGKRLEREIGTPAAATLIYLASDPNIERFPNFYCGDAEALADMKACAEREAALAKATSTQGEGSQA